MLAMFLTAKYKIECLKHWTLNIEVRFSEIMVWFKSVRSSRFSMDVIVRSNNGTVNDMTAPMSGLINDFEKAIKTKSSQNQFG